jgi:hypothetical protein
MTAIQTINDQISSVLKMANVAADAMRSTEFRCTLTAAEDGALDDAEYALALAMVKLRDARRAMSAAA